MVTEKLHKSRILTIKIQNGKTNMNKLLLFRGLYVTLQE